MLLYLIPFILIIAADQMTKLFAANNLALGDGFTLIPNFLDITYVQNQGAAFGLFHGKKIFLIIISALVFAAMIWYIVKYNPASKWLMWSLTLIAAGGIGNLIDRVALGYVRDFIDVTFTRFPVFNIADCGVTVGAIMLALYILIEEHKHGEDDFDSDSGCPQ
ncbi:MAG: signal peptidase II [Clostridia bacterium]